MLSELEKDELLELLNAYDRYIQDANDDDRYREGWYPVCIDEFYDHEFQALMGEDDYEGDWDM